MIRRGSKEESLVEQIVRTSTQKHIDNPPKTDLFPTGCTVYNLALGGGHPVGKIINIVGDKSTAKTLLATEVVALARTLYGDKFEWWYDDAEAGYSLPVEEVYGFNIIPDEMIASETVEEFGRNIERKLDLLDDGKYFIYVLDTLDGLPSEAEIKRQDKIKKLLEKGKEIDTGTYGLNKQKYMSEFFRTLCRKIKRKNCLLIIVSQVRENIGVTFGAKYVRMGGKALDFYASQVIWLAEAEKHYKKDRATGITIKAKITKNKEGKPFRQCYIDILFDYGVDDIMSNINFLYDLKTETGKQKKTEQVVWDGEKYSVRRLVRHIEQNNLEDELKNRTIQKWNDVEESISSKDRKRRF